MRSIFVITLLFSWTSGAMVGTDRWIEKAKGVWQTEAPKAWQIQSGSRKVVVAVIDTGIDIEHPDLKANIWTNPGESGRDENGRDRSSNGIDDDKNGFVDDVHGWNFVANNNDVSDHHGHGTHVAGIIGAVGNNGIGVSGMSPRVSLMAVKYYDPGASEANNLLNTIQAIRYANKMKVNIINYSGGGFNPFQAEELAIKESNQRGILFVAAAGNESSNLNSVKFYPANYSLENIVAVTGLDQKQSFLSSSNYGSETVHMAAPGEQIYSTLPNQKYGDMTGTSQATAFVSGAAALIEANATLTLKPAEVIRILAMTGEYDSQLLGKTIFLTKLNAHRALIMKDEGVLANGKMAPNGLGSRMLLSAHQPIPNSQEVKVMRGPAHQAPDFKLSDVGDR